VSNRGPETTERWGAPSTRTMVWHDPTVTASAAAAMTGLDFLRAVRDGVLPPPPMAAVLGFTLDEVEPGRVIFRCTPDTSTYNPTGVVHGGLVCTLADSATACAVHSTLEAGVGYTSIDLAVSYLRPVTKDSGVLRAEGIVTKPGRRVAFARAEIVDGAGRPVATATSSCLVIERR
jgi:uncharacterized protein (TIGR00369 family)